MISLAPTTASTLDVLCVGAHADDIEIGCGGTLLTMASQRSIQLTAIVMTGSGERQDETLKTLPRFVPGADPNIYLHDLPDGRLPAQWNEVKQILEDDAVACHPDIVFAPRRDDAHQDHRLLGELVSTVWRDAFVLHYEIPKWDGDLRPVTHYVPVDEVDARRKVALLNEGFPSQLGHDWWDDETFLGLMRIRGLEARTRYAEGFTAPKSVLSWEPVLS